ncbi:MAG: hydroxyacid dehydrogenase [Planctomycetes bacterium]|nr:hydroxyacid dehydrogenase [Planctomycetota bacterium]
MRVFVADKFEDAGIEGLKSLGCEVAYEAALKGDALAKAVRDSAPEVLIVRSTQAPRGLLEASPSLELVVRAGAGVNTIDVAAASALGVYVANCPGKNSIAVAELAFGLLLSLDRRIPENVSSLKEKKWNKKEFSKARGLHGRTLGVIGLGQIGQEMALRARAFGMKVVGWSRSLTPEKAAELGITRAASPEDVARVSDAVSVHVAAAQSTKGLCGKRFFTAMKEGTIFLNTARADVVDEAALIEAVRTKGVRAGLDVFTGEPAEGTGTCDVELSRTPGVYVTHHIGASTDQAQMAIAQETVRIVRVYRETGEVPNCVNLRTKSKASHMLVVRHRDRVGVLAAILDVLRASEINVQEMENVLFEGGDSACARIRVDREVPAAAVERIRESHAEILAVRAIRL